MQRDADRITKLFTRTIQRTVADFVKIGRELNTMKERGCLRRVRTVVPGRCHAAAEPDPVHASIGTSFMALAKHPILSEAKYHAHLPIAIGTLRELARLESAVVLRAIEDGAFIRTWTGAMRSRCSRARRAPPRLRADGRPRVREASDRGGAPRLWCEHPDDRDFSWQRRPRWRAPMTCGFPP